MSQAVNINFYGNGQTDGRCIPCLRISRGVSMSPRASRGNYKTLANVKIATKQGASKGISFICKASYNGHRRNPDFNQHRNQGFNENNNWKNEETDSSNNIGHSGYSSATGGLMNSLSSTPSFKVNETPGPREKEIVELFRKIQAQLRERSTYKEQKKMESVKGKFQAKGTVDSLLKLLRRHSSEQGARNLNGNANFELDTENHSVQNGVPNGFEKTGFSNASNHITYESKESNADGSSRPVSYFRRSSPISQAKNIPPANRRRSTTDCKPYIRNKNVPSLPRPVHELVTKLTTDPQLPESERGLLNMDTSYEESDEESSNFNSNVDTEEDVDTEEEAVDEVEQIVTNDLTTLKLAELRSMARSNGVKGFSKLKKSELVELLSKSSL